MEERTHSWIAIRALALLEDLGAERPLVEKGRPGFREEEFARGRQRAH